MNVTQLRTLLAIRHTGSFSAAAEAVHLSHSAVSTQMHQLERQLGAALFVKGRRPARLTAFGRRFADEAAPVVAGFDALTRSAGGDRTDGAMSIGFVPTTLQTLLPVVLRALGETYPDLRVRIASGLSGDLAQQVEAGRLDIAVVTAGLETVPALRQQVIVREPLLVVAPPGTSARSVADLSGGGLPYIAFARSSRLGQQIETGLDALGLHPDPGMEIDSIDAIETLVGAGLGWSILPQRAFAPDIRARMACLAFEGPAPARRLALVRRREFSRARVWQTLIALAPDG